MGPLGTRGLTITAGPAAIPVGIPQEELVSIGSCSLPEARSPAPFCAGLPAQYVDIIRALGGGVRVDRPGRFVPSADFER
jgi:hypothetical protein